MHPCYPPIAPYETGNLALPDGLSVHLTHTGRSSGLPVLFLTGWLPLQADLQRRLFDPDVYHIITLELPGKSSIQPMQIDMRYWARQVKALRQTLQIEQWVLCGTGCGALLAVLVAMQDDKAIRGMVLQGATIGDARDVEWLVGPEGPAAQMYPEDYLRFSRPHEQQQSDTQSLLAHYAGLLDSQDDIKRLAATKTWFQWLARIAHLSPHASQDDGLDPIAHYNQMAFLCCQQLLHRWQLTDNYLLDNIDKIGTIPGTILHGRYDLLARTQGVFALQKRWPNSQLMIVPTAGHSLQEAPMKQAMCTATDQLADFLLKEHQ